MKYLGLILLQADPDGGKVTDTWSLLERFGDAGLVFLVMALVIYFLYKEWRKERNRNETLQKEKIEIQKEFNEYVKENVAESTKTTITFSNIIDKLAEKITILNNLVQNKNNNN